MNGYSNAYIMGVKKFIGTIFICMPLTHYSLEGVSFGIPSFF